MRESHIQVSKIELFQVIRDVERCGSMYHPSVRKLVEVEEKARDALDEFRTTNEELMRLERSAENASCKRIEAERMVREENNIDVLKVRSLVRTQGATTATVAAVKNLAANYFGMK